MRVTTIIFARNFVMDTSFGVDEDMSNCDFEVVRIFEGSNFDEGMNECERKSGTRMKKISWIFGRCEGDVSVETRNIRWRWYGNDLETLAVGSKMMILNPETQTKHLKWFYLV